MSRRLAGNVLLLLVNAGGTLLVCYAFLVSFTITVRCSKANALQFVINTLYDLTPFLALTFIILVLLNFLIIRYVKKTPAGPIVLIMGGHLVTFLILFFLIASDWLKTCD